jgi:hypothetical protein
MTTLLEMRAAIVQLAQDLLNPRNRVKQLRNVIVQNVAIMLATLFCEVGCNAEQFESSRKRLGRDTAEAAGKAAWKASLASNFSNVGRILEEHCSAVSLAAAWASGDFTVTVAAALKDIKPAVTCHSLVESFLNRMTETYGVEETFEAVNSIMNSHGTDAEFYSAAVSKIIAE